VRGREYLRIIYGPDYTEPAHLDRLRQRGLSHKRSLALREYALGLEALDRVARGEPLWRARMRLRRAGPRIRTRRPEAVAMTVIGVPYHLDEYLADLDFPLRPATTVTAALPAGDAWERLAVLYDAVAGAVAGWVDPARRDAAELAGRPGDRGLGFRRPEPPHLLAVRRGHLAPHRDRRQPGQTQRVRQRAVGQPGHVPQPPRVGKVDAERPGDVQPVRPVLG